MTGLDVSIVRPHELAGRADACVVMDVLRATTTASVLTGRCGEIYAVKSPAELAHLPARGAGYAVFSELSELRTLDARFDNSPHIATSCELGARMPVLVTTNGTIAMALASAIADEVLLATFSNLAAVAAHLVRAGARRIVLVPAGNIAKQAACSEDDGCARVLAARLAGEPVDEAAIVDACLADERIVRRRSKEPILAEDLPLCFARDTREVVPRVVPQPDRNWFAVRAA